MKEREFVKRASESAKERARNARWDIDVAVFLFAVLLAVIVMLYGGVSLWLVTLIGFLGLVACWVLGWIRGRRLYAHFYEEEVSKLQRDRE